MKTTIEIADDLFERVQRFAREQKTTFRALTETGLRMVLSGRQRRRLQKASALATYGKGGLSEEFKESSCDRIGTEIYRGRGAWSRSTRSCSSILTGGTAPPTLPPWRCSVGCAAAVHFGRYRGRACTSFSPSSFIRGYSRIRRRSRLHSTPSTRGRPMRTFSCRL